MLNEILTACEIHISFDKEFIENNIVWEKDEKRKMTFQILLSFWDTKPDFEFGVMPQGRARKGQSWIVLIEKSSNLNYPKHGFHQISKSYITSYNAVFVI